MNNNPQTYDPFETLELAEDVDIPKGQVGVIFYSVNTPVPYQEIHSCWVCYPGEQWGFRTAGQRVFKPW